MFGRLKAATLAVAMFAAPAMALAQTEADATSTYSDTLPKKHARHTATHPAKAAKHHESGRGAAHKGKRRAAGHKSKSSAR